MKHSSLIFLLSFMLQAFCINTSKAQSKIEEEFQMKQYYMVFLKAGLNRTQDSTTAAGIQVGHLNNITHLFNEKKLIIAGPFLDNGIYKGIFIFDIPTEEEVKELLKSDPAVSSGRLDYEIHPWYGPGDISIGIKKEK